MTEHTASANEPQLYVLTAGGSIDKVHSPRGEMEIGPPAAGELLDRAGVTGHSIVPVLAKAHGTDTMPETGRHLLERIGHTIDKTVVLTGALRPAAMSHSDAAFDLGSAVLATRTLPPGVYVVMHATAFDVATVRKDKAQGRFV